MLLLFAYFFNAEIYNHFNQVYYTASIVILFGSIGFNIAVTRIKISIRLVFIAVLLNTFIAYFFLQVVSAPFNNIFEIISLLLYSIFSSLGGIYVFQLLFSGKVKEYVLLSLLYSILHLLIIPAVMFFHLNLFLIFPIVTFLWFLIGYPFYIKENEYGSQKLKELYKLGISAFIINSAVSLALAADKYFVNHFFQINLANSYTFAWSITAPMFYIGVLIEQFLFSETNTSKSNIIRKGFTLSILLVPIYAVAVLFFINFFPGLIPGSVDYELVLEIATLMIIGYSFYVILHFPINAFLFKSLGTEKQKTISIVFSIIVSVFVILYVLIFQEVFEINYIWLLIITWSYIFTLLISKVLIMFRNKTGESKYNSILEIQNLEP
jgi:hypothetical protein